MNTYDRWPLKINPFPYLHIALSLQPFSEPCSTAAKDDAKALLSELKSQIALLKKQKKTVRAGVANDLVGSNFTSIQQRIFDFVNTKSAVDKNSKQEKNPDNHEEKITLKLTKSNQKRILSKIKKQQKTEKLL